MTNVTLKRGGDTYTVRAQGHAAGSDIVCAAISTLIYTLMGYLINSNDIDVVDDRINDADVNIVFRGAISALVVFDMISIGFLELEKTYPQYIKVSYL